MVWIVPALAWVLCDALLVGLVGEEVGLGLDFLLVEMGVAVLACGAVLLVGALALRRAPTRGLVAAALTISAIAAAPIPVEYSDGCNSHTTSTPAALAPYVTHSRAEHHRLTFGGVQTLMACVKIA